ncbi:HAD-IA family hydrolase [Cellvibrio sp. NN19]|uniref:HAD-IA family hydrolase n=1 Tax=Cellvibrio chitinivorans TaxID=3102792 RepID=UPI002B409E2C|nr:HAD-IA family hydrolase [Cellvibrio sp. NN19]
MPKTIRAVMFDLDGTLLDTAPDFIVVVNQLLVEQGRPALPADTIRAGVSNGSKALIKLAFAIDEDNEQFEPLRQRLLELYLQNHSVHTKPFPGINELIAQLAAHNILWGIATNKPAMYTLPLMVDMNIQPPPASIICPDHVSAPKPNPESLFLAGTQLSCTPQEIIFIGDHKRDIDCGRDAGSITIAATYGYLDEGEDPATWNADHSVNHADEIWPIIEKYL